MTCSRCEKIDDISDLSIPYVVRICEGCNRQIHRCSRPEHTALALLWKRATN